MIRPRALVHLSYTARRTIFCWMTKPKQSKNDAKCARIESMKHIKGVARGDIITGHPSLCHVLCA